MKRQIALLALLNLMIPLAGGLRSEPAHPAYVIEITGEVDLSLPPYIRRVFADAKEHSAGVIVLHINTFGGRVDVATELKDAILDSKIPVIAFIDKRAISAGALIALSASKIAMTPGGSIGAATPVYGSGEKASEKVVSYMRGEMRATAERNGRDARLAEAMVDESLTISDSSLKRAGQLLTLTTEEALKVGFCDVEATTLEEALGKLGFSKDAIVRTEPIWSEHLVRFFTLPVMNSILIMLGLAGIFYGVKTGHFGAVTIIGIASMALFFSAQYLADLSGLVEIGMFIIGLCLIALEIFVIPGFGAVGILGGVMVIASLFLALMGNFHLVSYETLQAPLYTLAASFIGLAILVALMVHYLPTSRAFNKFVLNAQVGAVEALMQAEPEADLVDVEGEAVTTLRPAGVALIAAKRRDVITEGDFIVAGEKVRVVRVEGRKIIVRRSVA